VSHRKLLNEMATPSAAQREYEVSYWRTKGSSDHFLGHYSPPSWHEQWAQDAYLRGYNMTSKLREAQVSAV
jgi:hypothetical protein